MEILKLFSLNNCKNSHYLQLAIIVNIFVHFVSAQRYEADLTFALLMMHASERVLSQLDRVVHNRLPHCRLAQIVWHTAPNEHTRFG